jgi:hypothetical protein
MSLSSQEVSLKVTAPGGVETVALNTTNFSKGI